MFAIQDIGIGDFRLALREVGDSSLFDLLSYLDWKEFVAVELKVDEECFVAINKIPPQEHSFSDLRFRPGEANREVIHYFDLVREVVHLARDADSRLHQSFLLLGGDLAIEFVIVVCSF